MAASPNHVKVTHHSARVMFEDVAVVHPLARPIVRQPGDAHAAAWGNVYRVFPGQKRGWLAVYLEHLEEEAVQVERMVHQRVVHDVPDLQLPDLHGRVVVMRLAVDHELYAGTQARPHAQMHLARRRDRARDERFDAHHNRRMP